MHDKDDGPSDPAKVRATIAAALAGNMIRLPLAKTTSTTRADGTASLEWTRTVPHNLTPEDLAALDRFNPVPREAIESAGTAPGEVMCHCSEDDGVPDVGVSVGLGNDRALWIGDLLEREGANCGVVFHGHDEKGERTRIVAPFADGTDWQEVADLFRHHVGPAVEQLVERERFDVTKRPDVRQNALLAAEVLDRWRNDPTSEFTHGDAARAIGSIRQLLAAHDDMEVHRDAARDALSDMRDERDRLALRLADTTGTNPDAADRVSCILPDATPDVVASIVQAVAEALSLPHPVTHATRPEVEILLAGRKDLMADVDRWTTLLADREIAAPDCDEVASLLDRLGAYIVGQDTRLIAAGEALAEAQSELAAAVADRDKADAAHGCAVRDYRAHLAEEVDAHRRTVTSLDWVQDEFNLGRVSAAYWGTSRGEIAAILVRELRKENEGLKADVRAAEKAFEEEREKRERSDRLLGEQTVRMAELEMRLEGAAFALRHGMNEGVEAAYARFSPSTRLIDYLTAPMGDKPRCRVVTSPRFYSDADRERAADAFEQDRDGFWIPNADRYRLVDILAATLGMRRATS